MTKQQQFLYNELPDLLAQVQQDTKALWGIMSPQHMLEHVSGVNFLAMGKFTVPLAIPEENIPRSQAWLATDKMFRKNIRMDALPKKPAPLRFADIDEARQKVIGTIEKFKAHFDAQPDFKSLHPAFGDLNREQWEQFLYKHYRHHLMQFGIIPEDTKEA